MKIRTTLLAIFLITLTTGFAGNVYPCGDNAVYRVGQGLAYRVYTAPLPGHVLIYGQTDADRELALNLVRSGHAVRLVSSDQELQNELDTGTYDVVLAAYSDRQVVESKASAAASQPTLVPVAETRAEEKQARQNYQHVMQARKNDIKQYLLAIHKTLKNKG
ncbi:MAG TPA: hypothetical protein VIS55_00750 [Pseudomonadales bacterium]